MEVTTRAASYPFMDLDELPDGLVGVDDMYLGHYLKGVEVDAANSGVLPSLDLPDDMWMAPSGLPHSSGQLQGALPFMPGALQQQGPSIPLAAHGSDSANSAEMLEARVHSEQASGRYNVRSLQAMHEAEHLRNSSSAADEDLERDDVKQVQSKSRGGSRKVTPQRKQNNRKAQQRYREKRKQQAANLEAQVALLSSELEAMKSVQGEAAKLHDENLKLKAQLESHQADIAELKADGKLSQKSSLIDTDDEGPSARNAPSSYDATLEQILALKSRMRDVLQAGAVSIDNATPETQLPAEVVADLKALLAQTEQVSIQMLLMAPSCPKEKVLKHRAARGAAHPCSHFRARWNRILENISLADEQQEQLLQARQHALDELRQIYEQRQHLNQITMSIMLPRQPSRGLSAGVEGGKYHASTDRKMECIERWGGGCMLSQSAELVTALRDLRANLSAERKMLVQLHTLLVQKVLTPLQAAIMFIQAETDPVEPLNISNLVATHKGLAEVPPGVVPLTREQIAQLEQPYSSQPRFEAALMSPLASS